MSDALGKRVADHAVIVKFDYGSTDLAELHRLEDQLEAALEASGTGELDGHELAVDGSDGLLFMYGPDADRLYASVEGVLAQAQGVKNAVATLRYGPAEGGVRASVVEVVKRERPPGGIASPGGAVGLAGVGKQHPKFPMQSGKPLLYWFVVMLFIWSAGRDLQLIVIHQRSVDFSVFQFHGQTNLFFAFLSATVLLDLAASYSAARPTPGGFWVCASALAVGLVYNITFTLLAMQNIPGAKAAYVAERELRGLGVNADTADRVFSPEGLRATLAMSVILSVVGLLLLMSQHWRFVADPESWSERR